VKFQRNKEQNTLVVRHFCERENMLHGVKKNEVAVRLPSFENNMRLQEVSRVH